MGRYDLPSPRCRHTPTVRLSSHIDLQEAIDSGEAVASTYCCSREACQADAKEWLHASTHSDEWHIVKLGKR